MKIIKEGTPPQFKTAVMHCDNYGCEFEATKGEFKFVPDQRDGDFWKITCPTEGCNQTLYRYGWN